MNGRRGAALVIIALAQLAIAAGASSLAAAPLQMPAAADRVDPGPAISYLEDPEGRLQLTDVSAPSFQHRFQPAASSSLNFGFTRSVYWLRIELSDSIAGREWLLQSAFPLLDRIDFYGLEGERLSHQSAGLLLPFSSRPIAHRNFVFRLHPPRQGAVYFLRCQTQDSMQMPLSLWSPAAFYAEDHNDQALLGAYFGIVAVMAVYNLFLFLSLRDRGYLLYIVYISLCGLFIFSQYGLAFEYLWPNWTMLARKMNPALAAALECGVLAFTMHFLDTSKTAPRLHRALQAATLAAVLASPLALLIPLTQGAIMVVFLGLAASLLCILAGFLSLQAGYRPARYYVTAFLLLAVGGALYALKTFGALPLNFVTQYGMQLGSVAEVTLLSLGLADRMNVLRRDKELAQRAAIELQSASLVAQTALTEAYARMAPSEYLRILGKNSVLELQPGDQVQRQMTVLFSDIRGFTALSESMTPAENFNFLNSYLRRMNPIIQRCGGHIDKYIGDSIMALFPNRPEDALEAAIGMQLELAIFNEHRRRSGYRPIEIGIGIHSGPVMLGAIGGEQRMELTVISDTVNLASRLEGLTKTCGAAVVVSDQSYELLENPDAYDLRKLGAFAVSGKSAETTVFGLNINVQQNATDHSSCIGSVASPVAH
ncbi:MAG: adenylate cyclase [Leptospirales bacterium]|nr:adenylate cyclase [Leptospirales bacterium]